jgi:hypothetical protein
LNQKQNQKDENDRNKVLLAFLEKETMTFKKKSFNEITCIIKNRNKANKLLKELDDRELSDREPCDRTNITYCNLIHEEGYKNWKPGEELEYTLTEKGKQKCVEVAFESADKAMEAVNAVIFQMFSKPEKLQELQRHLLKWNAENKKSVILAFQDDKLGIWKERMLQKIEFLKEDLILTKTKTPTE